MSSLNSRDRVKAGDNSHRKGIFCNTSPRLRIPFTPVYVAAVVCDKVWRAFGASPPLYPRRVEFFHLDRAFSIDKAKRLLGYVPKYSLDEGLARTAAWYREQKLIADA